MTRLVFLSPAEKRKFDLPPVLTHEQRPAYFVVTDDIRRTLSALRTATNKVGFLLQLGYFRESGKFFAPKTFRQRDIKYLKEELQITERLDFTDYPPARVKQQRARILELLGWTAFNTDNATQIARHVQIQAEQQIKPERVFGAAIDFCWQQRIEIPTHHQLANVITDSFNIVESAWLGQLQKGLEPSDCKKLDALLESVDGLPILLSKIKTINQSLQVKEIRKSVDSCLAFGKYFAQLESAYTSINLPEKATEHYATWVQKATLAQLKQFPSRWKRYLHLLAFIKHQYSIRQDVLMDILLKSTQSAINAAINAEDRSDLKNRAEQKDAIRVVTKAHKSAQCLLHEIAHITRCVDLAASERIGKIEQLLCDYETLQSVQTQEKLQQSELFLDQQTDTTKTYDALEKKSVSLQLKASPILKALVFDAPSSDADLLAAVKYFQDTDGLLGKTAPLDFLSSKEQALFPEGETFRVSLYKILLFQSVAAAVKAGKLNLLPSYRYRAIQDYLIPIEQWLRERNHLLAMAGLEKFADGAAVLAQLKETLDISYRKVNNRILADENEYLRFDKKGTAKIRTPKTAFSEDGYVGQTLVENGIVSVLQVLREVSQSCNFISCFKHLSPKHYKLKGHSRLVRLPKA